MPATTEDSTIIRLFQNGGTDQNRAFKLLVETYGELLYSQIRRIAQNHEYTNDILQNVFVKVFQNLADFNQKSSLYTWIYRIARNEALNFLEKEKRRTGVDIDAPALEIIAGHSLMDSLSPEKISELLQKAIDQLPEKQAMVFQLKYFEEMPYAEMSEKLGTSLGGLKASFHHAQKKIQEFILNELNQL